MKTHYNFKPIYISILLAFFAVSENVSAQGNYGYILSGSNGYSIAQFDVTTKAYASAVSFSDYSYTGTLNQRGTRLWITAYSTLYIINTSTKSVVTQKSFSSDNNLTSKPVFSPDGSKVYMLSGYSPMYVDERDTVSFNVKISHQIQNSNYPRSAPVLSQDGKKLYFLDNNYYLNEVNTTDWTSKRTSISSSSYSKLKLSPDDSLIFIYGSYNPIQVYKTSTLTSIGSIQVNSSNVTSLELSRDGKTMFVGFQNSYIQIFDISEFPSTSYTFATLPNYSYDLALDPNSDSLLFVAHNSYFNDNVSIYNIPLGQVTKTFSSNNYSYALVMPMKKDVVAPGMVANFQATAINYDAVRLKFIASGDDSISGNATFYDVRYDTIPVLDANFKLAKKVAGTGIPKNSGVLDSIDVLGLHGETTYYFAVKVGDEVLNLSPIATASATTPAPAHISYQLDAISGIVKDNDSLTLSLKIQNTGDADLLYKISLLNFAKEETLSLSSALFSYPGIIQPIVPNGVRETNISAAGYKVLLLHSDGTSYVNDVKQKLLAQGGFSTIDTYSANSSTPTLEYLQNYNVVFVWSNNSFYNSTSLGNLLADYVDAGGNVVTALFALVSSGGSIQGRFNYENYWAIMPGSNIYYPRATLGTISKPNHPIMKGVKTFDGGWDGSNGSFRLYSNTLASNATLIASWSDGIPLVAEKTINGKKRVDLGFYPPSSDVSQYLWVSSTDGAKIIANALKYAAGSYINNSGENIVTFSPDSGSVSSGQTQTITVTLKTVNALPGDYSMVIGIESNDPDSMFAEAALNFTIQDVTSPKVGIRFFPNEAFPDYLSIVSVAHEKLYSPVMKAGVGSDTTQTSLSLLDTINFVYNSRYKMDKSGAYFAVLEASDSLGNHSKTIRQIAAVAVTPKMVTKIVSIDGNAQMELPQYSVDNNSFILASADDETIMADQENSVSSVYRFAPQSVQLSKPALLMIKYVKPAVEQEAAHYGIFTKSLKGEWMYIPTQHDAEHQALYAKINSLGDFRIVSNPEIQTEEYKEELPASFALQQNYPNPFNPSTLISYQLPSDVYVTLNVYNILGQEVIRLVDEVKTAGQYSVQFNAAQFASGVYFYKLHAGTFSESKKMVLMK